MIKNLNIHVIEDSSSVRLKGNKYINPKTMKTSSNQKVPYYSIDCMINEVSKNLKISIDEIRQSFEIMSRIQKKWDTHFNKLIESYVHQRVGFVLLSHHQEIFYNIKNAENRIYPFCNYPTPQVKIVNESHGYSEYGGIEIINEYDKTLYVFLNNKKDRSLGYDFVGDGKIKYNNFLQELENYLNGKKLQINFTDKNEILHKYTVKFFVYKSDFYDRVNYYGPDDIKYFENFIDLKGIEKKIGFIARKDENTKGNYYFYECDECEDIINRKCKTCRSKKYATSFRPLTFGGPLSNEEYNKKNIDLYPHNTGLVSYLKDKHQKNN